MDIQVGEDYILHSKNKIDFKIHIVKIDDSNDSEISYSIDVWDKNGNYFGDVLIVGKEFFEENDIKKCE